MVIIQLHRGHSLISMTLWHKVGHKVIVKVKVKLDSQKPSTGQTSEHLLLFTKHLRLQRKAQSNQDYLILRRNVGGRWMSYFNTMCVPLCHCSMKKVSWRKPPKAKSSRSWRSTLVKTVQKHHRRLIQQRLGTSLMLWQTFARSNRRLVVTLVNFAFHSCVSFSRQLNRYSLWLHTDSKRSTCSEKDNLEIFAPMTLAFSCEVVHKKLWKSVNICKSYGKKTSGTFFPGHGVSFPQNWSPGTLNIQLLWNLVLVSSSIRPRIQTSSSKSSRQTYASFQWYKTPVWD